LESRLVQDFLTPDDHSHEEREVNHRVFPRQVVRESTSSGPEVPFVPPAWDSGALLRWRERQHYANYVTLTASGMTTPVWTETSTST
jgi:hypothetical protein